MKGFPDFTKVSFGAEPAPATFEQWRIRFEEETGKSLEEWACKTLEQIDLQPLYTAENLKSCEHLDTMPGLPPFLRGPYGSMYASRPWIWSVNTAVPPLSTDRSTVSPTSFDSAAMIGRVM